MINRLTDERLAHLRTAVEVGIRMSGLGPHTVQVKPAELAALLDEVFEIRAARKALGESSK